MPIFELDEGRPRLVQPMQPLAGSFAQEASALLSHHLAAIAGEPLFAVRSRSASSDHADLPALLALDATGRAVVVDVGQVLDDDAIVSALRHAGAAARMTTTDLARAYHPDPSRFAVDFAAFREQAAFGTQSSRREGVRLILLCSEVAAEASDTLAFLRGPGRHVDVLQVGVVRGEDERRLLDVSPLATHEGGRRSVEPTALRLVRASEGFAGPTSVAPPRKPSSGELRAVTPPASSGPSGSPVSVGHTGPTAPTPIVRRAAPVEEVVEVDRDGSTRPLPTGTTSDPVPTAATSESVPTTATPEPGSTVATTGTTGTVQTTEPAPTPPPLWRYEPERIVAPPAADHAPTTLEAPTTLTPVVGLRAAQEQTPPVDQTPARPVPPQPSDDVQRDLSNAVAGPRPFVPASSHADAPSNDQVEPAVPVEPVAPVEAAPDTTEDVAQVWAELARAAHPTQPLRPARPFTRPAPLPVEHYGGPERSALAGVTLALPELATLAKSRRAVTTLVWVRERRGQRIEVLLRSDGLIELPSGEVFADPDAAASVSVASENPVDGWRAWRLGEGGPTLAEATGVIRP